MKKYKKIFGFLFPHKKGGYVKIDDVADMLFPLAYVSSPTVPTEELRKILAEEIWGSFVRTLFEVQHRNHLPTVMKETSLFDGAIEGRFADYLMGKAYPRYTKQVPSEDNFYEFLNTALKEKVKLHGDRPFLSIEGFRKWVYLKHSEYVALKPLEKMGAGIGGKKEWWEKRK